MDERRSKERRAEERGSRRPHSMARREFLSVGGASMAGAILAGRAGSEERPGGARSRTLPSNEPAPGGPGARQETRPADALTFDVFGTVVDWRTSIIREGEMLAREKGFEVDWAEFADRWRGGYLPAMDRVRRGEIPWTKIDALHRRILDDLLVEFGLTGLTDEEIDHLNRVWHRLIPWPDSVRGLQRLRSQYLIATLSNGNVSLLTRMAKNAGLPWDCILSAELAGHYKPDAEVYQTAAELLSLPPERVMMVAAHKGDLRAARGVGFRTAFVARPLEYGPDRDIDTSPEPWLDYWASDFLDLADQLGA